MLETNIIRTTVPCKPTVSETIKDRQGILISNKEKRLDRWAEHFKEQFNLLHASVQSDAQPTPQSLTVNLNPPSISEIREAISSLKRHRAPGPDNLPPAMFKDMANVSSSA